MTERRAAPTHTSVPLDEAQIRLLRARTQGALSIGLEALARMLRADALPSW